MLPGSAVSSSGQGYAPTGAWLGGKNRDTLRGKEGLRPLDPIEKAIRSAFAKGDVKDRAFREKVYRSAFAALDRTLKAHPQLTVEAAINRRKALQATITRIEQAIVQGTAPRPGPAAEGVPTVEPVRTAAQPASAPEISLGRETAPRTRQGGDFPKLDADGRPHLRRRRRRPAAIAFALVTLLAVTGIGGWFALQTGLFKSAAERDTTVPNPPQTVEEEDFAPGEEAAQIPGVADVQRDWVTLFSPADADAVETPSGGSAEAMRDDTGEFLRIRAGTAGEAVVFLIARTRLDELAGRRVRFDIVARAEEGQETQISVTCDFGALGDCGRRRYVVGYQRGEFLFDLDFADRFAGADGAIAINPDFQNQGRAVDIYEIRVAVTE